MTSKKATTSSNGRNNKEPRNSDKGGDEEMEGIASLRRMSTHELITEDDVGFTRRSSRPQAVESVRAVTAQLSKRTSATIFKSSTKSRNSVKNGRQPPKPRKLKTTLGISSHQKAMTEPLKKKQESLTNFTATRSLFNKSSQHSVLALRKSLSNAKESLLQRTLKIPSKSDGTSKKCWFLKGATLALRTENADEFYLCRTRCNVYNCTKQVKINWFTKKQNQSKMANIYKLTYRDSIDPASIMLEVNLNRLSKVTYQLPTDQIDEILKLLRLAQDVEKGRKTLNELDDDVEQVMLIDPPAPKKPRLQKTVSQKIRDKAKRLAHKLAEPIQKGEKRPRQRKINKNKDGSEPVRKRAAKKTEPLLLHPRPDIQVLELDPLFHSREPMPYISKVANSKLIFRAIYLKDNKLLTKLLKNGSNIYKLYCKSIDNEVSPALAAGEMNDSAMLLTLLHEIFGKKFEARKKYNKEDKIMLGKLDTGRYNSKSLGIRFIRKITASRGSCEGNNAFMRTEQRVEDEDNSILSDLANSINDASVFKTVEDFFENEKKENIYSDVFRPQDVHYLLLKGHHYIAGKIIQSNLKDGSRGFNHLFRDVLLFNSEELTGCSPSNVQFVSRNVYKLSPIHCAAANPNSKYLEKLLSVLPNVHMVDARGNRPIHFAAASSSSSCLKLLIEKGANLNDTNNLHKLPLHVAIEANRPENVQLLLETAKSGAFIDPFAEKFGVGGVNRRDNFSRTPLHIAAEMSHVEVAEVLLKYGADVNAKLNVSKNQLSPLMCAAAQGNLKMVQLLMKYGANVQQLDRMSRTAVIHGCMNGATSVLSYLLHIGASPEHPDNSGNAPIHYAAAYGWYFTVKLLLDVGADPNVSNMWRMTPVNIAYLKSQIGIMQELLRNDKVDINFTDDDGLTLLFHACSSDLLQTDLVSQIRYMIKDKGALCTLVDKNGQTPLHYLAANVVNIEEEEKEFRDAAKAKALKQSVAIAELLIEHGCDPVVLDNQNNTAAMVALSKVVNLPLGEFLIANGCPILLPPSGDTSTTLLHHIAENIWVDPMNLNKILDLIEKYDFTDTAKEMARYVDSRGLSPLHAACIFAKDGQIVNSDDKSARQKLKESWDNVRLFIRRLVDDFKANVDEKVQKCFFTDDERPSPDSNSWWYCRDLAGKTAAHIIMLGNDPIFDSEFNVIHPGSSGQIFKDLVLKGADVNITDEDGRTPLATCISKTRTELFDFLKNQGHCDFNKLVKIPDKDNDNFMINPLLYACHCFASNVYNPDPKAADMICELIELCDINSEYNNKGYQQKILHYLAKYEHAVIREGLLKIVEKLSKRGYDFNCLDSKKRTAMHYALMGNKGDLNQSHELEVRLIQLGTQLGLVDKDGRTALHYVFKKGKSQSSIRSIYSHSLQPSSNDAAELAKLIGRNMTAAEINQQDKNGRTVLHFAAKHGATISCMYLTLVGASVNVQDRDGNTPLNLAVQMQHDGCATTLIQSGADLRSEVIILSKEELQRRKQMKAQQKNINNEEKDINKEIWQWHPVSLVKKEEDIKKISLYQAAIEYNLNGVTMFVTEADFERSGLTDLDVIRIALKSCKYHIALRLLCTTTDLSKLHRLEENGQNLLHTLALSGENHLQEAILIKIAEFLLKADVPLQADEYKCSPIIYAVLNRNFDLANFLAENNGDYDVKYTDGFGRSYLAAALWRSQSKGIDGPTWDFIQKLIEKKINVNQLFDLPLNPELARLSCGGQKQDADYWQRYPDSKTTALIVAISCNNFIVSHNLLQWGANPNTIDGNQQSPLMHAIILNQANHVKQLLNYEYDPNKIEEQVKSAAAKKQNWLKKSRTLFQLTVQQDQCDESSEEEEMEVEEKDNERKDKNDGLEFRPVKKTSPLNLSLKDGNSSTALHYVAKTHSAGTFDNPEIAFVLVKAGAKLTTNSFGLNPYQLALKSGAQKVSNVLKEHFKLKEEKILNRGEEFTVNDQVPSTIMTWPDFKHASEIVLQGNNSSVVVEDKYVHEVDTNCNITNGELLKDEEQDLFYDVLMTKVDVKQGEWGLYNFYQMQLVSQPKKELIILFTRWGRMEDKGQYQHTPYKDKIAAVKEFAKIFREKTGNKWTEVKNFEKKPNKYRLVEDEARKAPPRQKEVDINLTSDVPSIMPKQLHHLIETLMNPTAMKLSMTKKGDVNSHSLTFGQLNKELLIKGKQILDQIENLVDEVEKYRTSTADEKQDEEKKAAYSSNLEKIAELSNDYFHVICTETFSYEKIRPLDQRKKLMAQVHFLDNLLDYEVACKMLLGAMHYKSEYNPVDFVYHCLGCKVEQMNQGDAMSQMILKYIYTGGKDYKVHGIYKISHGAKSEKITATGLGNRRLLWHGSNKCNLLSILNRGLLICPPEAKMTGWAYGKGIYFSDDFKMSARYISLDGKSGYMLLCEVALGTIKDFCKEQREEREFGKRPEKPHNSVLVQSYKTYNSTDWFTLPSGVSLPQGIEDVQGYTQYIVKDPAQVCLRYLIEFST